MAVPLKWPWNHALAEVVGIWALCFTSMLVASLFSPLAAKVVATLGFLYWPVLAMNRRGEESSDYGLSLHNIRQELRLFAQVSAVVLPLFVACYLAFVYAFAWLPTSLSQWLTPYQHAPHFTFRLPARFPEWCIDQLFVVALPEEFFYRGFVHTRLKDLWPKGFVFLGARIGKPVLFTAILFALGHLAIFQVWRLAVFFPALLFGWMREKHQGIVGAALFHAASNLTVLVLDACFFNR